MRIERGYERLKGPVRRRVENLLRSWNIGLALGGGGFTGDACSAIPSVDAESRAAAAAGARRGAVRPRWHHEPDRVRRDPGRARRAGCRREDPQRDPASGGGRHVRLRRLRARDDAAAVRRSQAAAARSGGPRSTSIRSRWPTSPTTSRGASSRPVVTRGPALAPFLEFTRGHPQRSMMLAHYLWQRTRPGTTADEGTWLSALDQAAEDTAPLMRAIWKALTTNERRVARALAVATGPLYSEETAAAVGIKRSSIGKALESLVANADVIREAGQPAAHRSDVRALPEGARVDSGKRRRRRGCPVARVTLACCAADARTDRALPRAAAVRAEDPVVSLGEGSTPLVHAPGLSERVGAEVWCKLEGLNPTGSFKDRGMTCAVSAAVREGAAGDRLRLDRQHRRVGGRLRRPGGDPLRGDRPRGQDRHRQARPGADARRAGDRAARQLRRGAEARARAGRQPSDRAGQLGQRVPDRGPEDGGVRDRRGRSTPSSTRSASRSATPATSPPTGAAFTSSAWPADARLPGRGAAPLVLRRAGRASRRRSPARSGSATRRAGRTR